jgi:hypothetical protein
MNMDLLARQQLIEMHSGFAVYLGVAALFLVVTFAFRAVDRWFKNLGRLDDDV